jgi:hypothetical protein
MIIVINVFMHYNIGKTSSRNIEFLSPISKKKKNDNFYK